VNAVMNLAVGFFFWVAENLLPPQEGLCSMELICREEYTNFMRFIHHKMKLWNHLQLISLLQRPCVENGNDCSCSVPNRSYHGILAHL
jgi:hypothetical protein